MTNPFVSIIIPTYNRALYIGKAIDSVLAQTYQDWELIIWNDGSTDETEQIVKSYKDPRIRYYYEVNHGKCYALNNSISLSKGKWIAILDDDDQWRHDKLEMQVRVVNKYPQIDVLFTNYSNLNEVTGEQGFGFSQNKRGLDELTLTQLEEQVFLISDKFPEGISTANFVLPSSTIIKKSIFKKVGLFNEELRNAEDAELWWRIYLHGFFFAFTTYILVDRFKPQGSLSSVSVKTFLNVLNATDLIRDEIYKFNRQDLLHLTKKSYRKAWLGILKEYAKSGERKKAWGAFLNSLQYGFSMDGLKFLAAAFLGPKIINKIRRSPDLGN